jgi:hypothetical protein
MGQNVRVRCRLRAADHSHVRADTQPGDFEFLVGHYVMGHPWSRLLHDYNILAGRLWGVSSYGSRSHRM